MLFPLAQCRERPHALFDAVTYGVGQGAAAAATVAVAHAWQAVAGVEPGQCVARRHDATAECSTTADAGKITITQLAGGTHDLDQGAGIDGERVGIWVHGRIAHCMGLHGTGQDNFAVASGLNNGAPAQQDADAARHQQLTMTTTCMPHEVCSLCAADPSQRDKERALAVPLLI